MLECVSIKSGAKEAMQKETGNFFFILKIVVFSSFNLEIFQTVFIYLLFFFLCFNRF